MNLDDALQVFIVESRELLEDMETALLAAAGQPASADMINAIFRAAHTIKGSAGLFGLDHIVSFTHVLESVLDRLRDGELAMDANMVALLLSCCDHMGALTDRLAAGQTGAAAELDAAAAPLLAGLRAHLGQGGIVAVDAPIERIARAGGAPDHWHLSLRFGADVLRNGMDPLSFIRYLGKLGRIAGIATVADALPAAGQLDPESCYLGFEIAFLSGADKAAIEAVFEFVIDDCTLHILAPDSRVSEYLRLIAQLPESPERLGQLLVRCGSLTARELDAALAAQSAAPDSTRLGDILVGQGACPPAVVEAALAKQSQGRRASESRSIRVDADKLDLLINLVGELIIAGARTDQIARQIQHDQLQECASGLSTLVEEVRDSALQLRMVKIGATFGRFQRVVHDVAQDIDKDIALSIAGEDTELDKTVVEKIGDPLTHLVRNAIDHGIEDAATRAAAGKPARGTVGLNAYHDSGSIVIEVSDDGGGLPRDKILAKAIARGLVEPDRKLSDAEIYAMIFEPGFSTAETVTNLSGRGVGMDVVKRNIAALRGSVAVDSQCGVGTTVTVRLPLTLAIIKGFLVAVGRSVFVIPLDVVEECVDFSSEVGNDYTNLRGQLLPFVRLREVFGMQAPPARRENIVVIRHAGLRIGLVVDALMGEFQTVIKPLGQMFSQVPCISGSTILGSGEVALIVDVAALMVQIGKPTQQAA